MLRALRLAARRLWRAPLYSLSVVAVLALAGAALTATGVIAYGILVAPLPYEAPGELAFLQRQSIRTGGNLNFTPADFLDVAREARTLEPVAAAGAWSPVITGMDAAERLRGLRVSGELFPLLGRRAIFGRILEPSDDSPEAAPAAVISSRLYKRMFGGDPSAIGREVRLDGVMFTIVGVMPAGFEFPTFWTTGVDIWAPMRWTPEEAGSRNAAWVRAFGRLAPGASLEQAQAEISTISESLRAQFPDSHVDRGVAIVGLQDQTVREVRPALTALAAGAALLWLLAIVNLTALAVVRATGRTNETAVRRALGESRARGFGQEGLESGLLALTGAALGAFLGYAAIRTLAATAPGDVGFLVARWREIPFATWMLVSTLVPAAAATGALAAAGAMAFVGAPLVERLRARADAGGSRRTAALRSLLTGGEIAVAVVLLAAAGLVGRSLMKLSAIDPGFRPERVTSAIVPVTGSSYGDETRKSGFYRTLLERVQAAPGVESAAMINHVPLVGDLWGYGYLVEGEPLPAPGTGPNIAFRVASPEYFQTIGATLLAGRDFTAADDRDAPLVVVANETFARRHFGGAEQAIGKRARLNGDGEPWREIVGVTADLQLHSWAYVGTEMFFPLEQERSFRDSPSPQYALTVVIRSSSGSAVQELRRIVADLDPTIPVDRVITLEAAVDQALWQPRLTAWVMGVFAFLALALAGIGVYGTAAQAAARRRAEFGVRLALGATRRDVLALALGRSLRFVGAGVGVGLALAWGLSGLLRDLLYEVSATDGLAFAGACALLAFTGLVASYLPARRAAAIDPATALRQD
jgi:predicted permease